MGVITLNHLIKTTDIIQANTVGMINVRRPLVADLLGLDFNHPETSTENLIVLIHRLTGLSIEHVKGMDMEDLTAVSRDIGEMAGTSFIADDD